MKTAPNMLKPTTYLESASVIISRLFKPSETHFIPVATVAAILGLNQFVVLDLLLDCGFVDFDDQGALIGAELRFPL